MKYKLALFSLIFCACSTTGKFSKVTIPKGTRLMQSVHRYSTGEDGGVKGVEIHKIRIFETRENLDGVVKVDEEKIRISLYPVQSEISPLIVIDSIDGIKSAMPKESDYRLPYKYEYDGKFIGVMDAKSWLDTSAFIDPSYALGKPFRYWNAQIVFQSITVPFKIRPKLGDRPYEVTTGVNVGVAIGRRWNFTRVKPIYNVPGKKMVGYLDNQFSFALAFFSGLTTIKLTPSNTDEMVTMEKTVLGLDYGIAGTIGINKLNLGLALGWDSGFGKEATHWNYQTRPWFGVIVGLELIK